MVSLLIHYVHPNIWLIHYVVTHIIILRKFNLGKVSKTNFVLTRLLAKKVETNWENGVICHMIESRRKGISLLRYGDLVSKILEHFGLTLDEEESVGMSKTIGKHALGKMLMIINNGVVVHKPRKEKEATHNQQALTQQQAPL